jgi:ankyrin repeat protein
MAEMRFCVGFSSACKQAREGGGLPGYEGQQVLRPFLPPDLVRLIDALVRRLAHEDTLLCMNEGDLASTLCEAAAAGGLLDVRCLLAWGADVDAWTVYTHADGDEELWTPLEWAVDAGHLAVCDALVDAGALEIDWALYCASYSGHTAIVAMLLEKGAEIHDDEAQKGHLATATLLLDRGADVHARDGGPLIMASQAGHLEMIQLLLDRSADIHAGDDRALHLAAEAGRARAVRLLLDRGADIHADNELALRVARSEGHVYVEALLLERGAMEPQA